jgi:hypothetical protein
VGAHRFEHHFAAVVRGERAPRRSVILFAMADDAPPRNDPRAFARWFLERATEASGLGAAIAVDEGELRLTCAAALLERGLWREALADANRAAALDPRLRERALEIARRCVSREIEAIRAGWSAR